MFMAENKLTLQKGTATDYEVDSIISDDTISLQKLASDARVQHIIERTE
ncbi:hypothetical protein QS423_11660 [Staphylococcus pseudintermedius]|nr:hypothetical protein QS423_11660 [Staphylococcus pseudintermedius]